MGPISRPFVTTAQAVPKVPLIPALLALAPAIPYLRRFGNPALPVGISSPCSAFHMLASTPFGPCKHVCRSLPAQARRTGQPCGSDDPSLPAESGSSCAKSIAPSASTAKPTSSIRRNLALEVDGYGNALMIDMPTHQPGHAVLSSILRCGRALYQRTRRFASAQQSLLQPGKAAGRRQPHEGINTIWRCHHLRALTATETRDRQCLRWLRDTTAGTGFMHESFKKDDAGSFPRAMVLHGPTPVW